MRHVYYNRPETGGPRPDFTKVGKFDTFPSAEAGDPGFGANLEMAPEIDVTNLEVTEKNDISRGTGHNPEQDVRIMDSKYEDRAMNAARELASPKKLTSNRYSQENFDELKVREKTDINRGKDQGREEDAGVMTDNRYVVTKKKSRARVIAPELTPEKSATSVGSFASAGQLERNLPGYDYKDLQVKEKADANRGTETVLAETASVMDFADERDAVPAANELVIPKDTGRETDNFRKFEHRRAIDIAFREALEAKTEASNNWFTEMARGARDVAKSAGSLWNKVAYPGKDAEFIPENVFAQSASEIFGNLKGMVKSETDQPSLLKILGEDLSIYDLGKTVAKGISEISRDVTGAVTEVITRKKAKELKEAAEDFGPTLNISATLQEIFGGAAEGLEAVPSEILDRHAELSRMTKYVLGGGFLKEIYAGIQDKVTGKERKAIEAALAESEGELILPAAPDERATTWSTATKGMETDPAKLDQSEMITRLAAREAASGLRETTNLHREDVTELSPGYGKMFTWIAEQYRKVESAPRLAVERNHEAELKRQAAGAAAERAEVAAQELTDNAVEAQASKEKLVKTADLAREEYLNTLDDLQQELARRTREIARDKTGGSGVELLKAKKASLEREITAFQAAQQLDKEPAGSHGDYQAMLDEAEDKLSGLNKLLDKPQSKEAKQMIKKAMAELEHQMDTYEALMTNIDTLANLTPDVRKESAAA